MGKRQGLLYYTNFLQTVFGARKWSNSQCYLFHPKKRRFAVPTPNTFHMPTHHPCIQSHPTEGQDFLLLEVRPSVQWEGLELPCDGKVIKWKQAKIHVCSWNWSLDLPPINRDFFCGLDKFRCNAWCLENWCGWLEESRIGNPFLWAKWENYLHVPKMSGAGVSRESSMLQMNQYRCTWCLFFHSSSHLSISPSTTSQKNHMFFSLRTEYQDCISYYTISHIVHPWHLQQQHHVHID